MQQKSCSKSYFSGVNLKRQSCCNRVSAEKQTNIHFSMSGGLNVRVYNNVFTIQLQSIKCHTVNRSCNIKTPQTQCITDRSMLLWKQNNIKKKSPRKQTE